MAGNPGNPGNADPSPELEAALAELRAGGKPKGDADAFADAKADAIPITDATGIQSGDTSSRTSGPRAKTFSCARCGASVSLKYPGASMSITCSSCGCLIDVTDENYAVLNKYLTLTTRKPVIPLGTRGKLKDRTWEVIGFLIRKDAASSYEWEEYLLFNPYYGYRWLTNNQHHWSFVTPIKEKPETVYREARLDKAFYKLYYKGRASIEYVIGEFYWRVTVGNKVEMEDYICPPYMLSREQDATEVNWSKSEYLESEEVETAFKLKDKLLKPFDIAPNQPVGATDVWNIVKYQWLVFIVMLFCIQVTHHAFASEKTLLSQDYPFVTNQKKTDFTTATFTVDKPKTNVEIYLKAPVDNSWFYAAMELVNDKTGDTYPFERTVEYYSGYDSDGSWSEGSTDTSMLISSVPQGQYYLNIDTESGDFKTSGRDLTYTLRVREDVKTWANFLWSLLFISIIPILCFVNSRHFEQKRWENSDYSPFPDTSSNWSSDY